MTKKKPPICCIHKGPIPDGPVVCIRLRVAAAQTKINKDMNMCLECAGAITHQFYKLMQQHPEMAALAGLKIKEPSRIIKPGDVALPKLIEP